MITLLETMGPSVWRASWQAALLAILVALALWTLGERVTPRWRYLLWSVVAVRLLFVVTPASPWSVFNLVRFESGAAVETVVARDAEQSVPEPWLEGGSQPLAVSNQPPAVGGQEAGATIHESEDGYVPTATIAAPSVSTPSGVPATEPSPPVYVRLSVVQILTMCWLVGCVACIVRLLVAAITLRRRLRVCRPLTDPAVLNLLETTRRQLGLRRTPVLLVTPEPISPCLVGTWRPRIVVPESLMTEGSESSLLPLRQVLAHELAHVVRGDHWINWPLLAAGTLHWSNPVAWWALREMRAEREAACDDMALAVCQGTDRDSYAETLLGFVAGRFPSPVAPGMIGLFSSKRSLARRMERILRAPLVTPLRPVIAAGLLLFLGLMGLTDAMPSDPPIQPAEEVPARTTRESASSRVVDLPLVPEPAGYVIHGRCYDNEDRSPVAGVRLRLFVAHGLVAPPEEIAETVSDGDGRFEFTGLIPPRDEMRVDRLSYGVVAQAEGRPLAATLEVFHRTNPEGELWIWMPSGPAAELTGRVTNQQGQPVVGATVTRYEIAGRPVLGIYSAVTDEDGQFVIVDMAAVEPDPDRPGRVGFRILHPDYLVTRATAPMLPADVEVVLPDGCALTGLVQDEATGQEAAGVVVMAEHVENPSLDRVVLSDAAGRIRLVVAEGVYNVLVESADRVCLAVAERECLEGQEIELPPLVLNRGGFIAGRVVNADNGEPVVLSDQGSRIMVGLYGPSRPPRGNVISPTPLVMVDDEGQFLLRAAAGENFPYLHNRRGNRMAWNTRDQAAVVVKEGETVNTEILIETPLSPEEKMEAARRVVAGLSEEPTERVAQIIEEFRKLNHTVDETELWCLLMRELATIGSDAVPQLIAELDQTTEGLMMRRLGFALRAIGDPRAVPALIRAVPMTLYVRGGDFGLIVKDAELSAFMQEHDWGGRTGQYFDFERPFREIVSALQKLTGQDFGDAALESISLIDDPRGQILQRRMLDRQAIRWQEWWEDNWRDYTDDVAYALVNLTINEEPLPPAPVGLGPDATTVDRTRGLVLSPSSESGRHLQHFFDLDTGYEPLWPEGIPRNEGSAGLVGLSAWAAENGVDLMCVEYESPDGSTTYVLRAFDLQVREISARELSRIDRLVGEGTLPEGRPAVELLLHYNAESEEYVAENGAFLYVTREGGMGVIEVTDRVTRVANLGGPAGSPSPGVGFHKGVRFNLTTIVP